MKKKQKSKRKRSLGLARLFPKKPFEDVRKARKAIQLRRVRKRVQRWQKKITVKDPKTGKIVKGVTVLTEPAK